MIVLQYLKNEVNMTRTENGAPTYVSTCSHVLDLFASVGALRRAEETEIAERFAQAYREDPDLAMKLLFFARDVRGGLGERRVFRVILRWLAANAPDSVAKNAVHIAAYGRFDDLLCLLGTPCERFALAVIREQLDADRAALEKGEAVSLLGKWLPSVNASNRETVRQGKRIARALGMDDAAYRLLCTALRRAIRILENNLRERDYTFDYEKQPSRALFKYRAAFSRNDGERYRAFLDRAAKGEAVLHTGALAPYDIIRPFYQKVVTDAERRAIDVTWNAQEDFTNGENALVVADGSGSMYGGGGMPAMVAQSLAIYFAERNTGVFRNHFITFSEHPQLVEITGADILEKVQHCAKFNEIANTNLAAVFRLILNTAVKHRLPQSELPSRLYIISDMEFDSCVEGGSLTNFEHAKRQFAQHGYALPEVVFWNVDSRNCQQPVTKNEQGAALVSGSSPRLFSMLRSGTLEPYAFMLEVLGSARYAPIAA